VRFSASVLLSFVVLAFAAVVPSAALAQQLVEVVEYYHADLDHYFITADPGEIASLDARPETGWTRTQATFSAYAPGTNGGAANPVCRLYSQNADWSTHFYSASVSECRDTATRFAATWTMESTDVFQAAVPDATTGACPANTVPVYRLYNGKTDPNHRYTTDMFVRAQMIIAGYQPEGYGSEGVVFCSPNPLNEGPAKIVATRISPDTYGFSGSAAAGAVIVGYEWDFGDGQHGAGPTSMHRYTSSGGYNVTLKLTDSRGTTSNVSTRVDASVTSTPTLPLTLVPTCMLTSSNPSPTTGYTVTLLASCNGQPRTYYWTNCTSSSNTCVTQSTTTGPKTYTVAGNNTAGTGSPASITLTWYAPGTAPPPTTARPTCTVSSSTASAIIGAVVTLTAACTGSPMAYAWTNCSSTTNTCAATASTIGTRSYSVTANNAGGSSTPVSTSVVWAAAPTSGGTRPSCTLTSGSASATVGSSVTLNASCTGSPTSYAWTGCSSTSSSCVARATSAGTASYSMTAANASGTSTSVSTQVSWSSSPASPAPIVGAPGTWTRYGTSVAAGTEAPRQSWYNLAWDTRRNRAYGISWSKTLSAFDPVQGRWTTVRAGGGINDFHNRTITYDPLNDRLWVSNGTGTEAAGFQYYDFASDQWVGHCVPWCDEPGNEGAMIYDPVNKRLIGFGGWNLTPVRVLSLQPVDTRWRGTSVTGGPVFNSDIKKMTAWRTFLDTPRNRIVYVDVDGSLWTLPLSLSGWQRITTNGTPPPAATQFIYDVANDAIVGWAAGDRVSAGDPSSRQVRETWTMSFSNLTWTRAASAASGATVPPDAVYVGFGMVYDPVRAQTLMHTIVGSAESDTQTWAYRHPGGAAPPPSTTPPPTSPPPAPTAPSCTLAASSTSPTVGATLSLTASCSGSPTSYTWSGCSSSGSTCSAQSTTSGARTYSVTASNAGGTSSATSLSVTWQFAPVTPPPATPGNYTGVITSFPLPSLAGAPFSLSTASKHTNMASDGRRLYVSGGDWTTSATDGTWSMDLATGAWRQDVGAPVYPSLPAPHALQDGAGFVWVASQNKFLLWPGFYYAYESSGHPLLNYAKGIWWFDPATNQYTQDTRLFGTYGSSTGNLFGGIYDEVNNQIVAFGDAATDNLVKRWDVGSMTRLPDLRYNLSNPSGFFPYFGQGQHVKIGRHVYIVGYRTNGNRSSQRPILLRWHLDNRIMEEMAPPPADGTAIQPIEVRIGTSRGKVVWPFMTGPEGELRAIYVFDPAQNRWYTDTQVPSYGNFIANSVTSLPDGRIAMSGGVFGRHQTHMWFYDAQ
jgi:hypothetical protein